MTGTLSVCIPTFRGRFLARTIESVLAQTRPASEILVIDDCSPENIKSIVEPYASAGVRYIRNNQNIGVPKNYNHALRMAVSDYVMLLGDHDVMGEKFIESCAGLLDEQPEVGLVFSARITIDQDGQTLREYIHDFPRVFSGELLVKHLLTHVASPLTLDTVIRRSALELEEVWLDPKYWWYPDIDLWIRLATKWKVGYVADPVLFRRTREKTHYLNDKAWRSHAICDQIRNDNWHRGFPSATALASLTALFMYSLRKDRVLLKLAASHKSRTGNIPPAEARRLLSPFGRLIVDLIRIAPVRVFQDLRKVYHRLELSR